METAAKARNIRFSETLLYRLDRFASQVTKAAESRLREASGMSFSQFLVLMALLENGPAQQSQIADYVGVTPAVITKQVEQLAGKGWLQLGPSHQDRRANVVRLTDKGGAAARAAIKQLEQAIRREINLAEHYQTKLTQLLRTL